MKQETKFLYSLEDTDIGNTSEPRLFIMIGTEILELILAGTQILGRPTDDDVPDIPIVNPYISRRHGTFETKGTKVIYIPAKTTNPTIFRGKELLEGETIELLDGDELTIPTGGEKEEKDILFAVVTSASRIQMWRQLRAQSLEPHTRLAGRHAFYSWYAQNVYGHPARKVCLFLMDIDMYQDLVDLRGAEVAGEAFVVALEALKGMPVEKAIFQWSEASVVCVADMTPEKAYFIFDELSDLVGRTLISGSIRITVSIGYMDMGKAPGVERRNIEELTAMLRGLLDDAKKREIRGCLVEWC